jgi:PAS domain S-box-containing protein
VSSHAGRRAGVPKLWRSLLVAALIPLTLVSLGAWLAGQYERVAADNASVNLSFRQQIAMQSLFSGMKDAETGQRGYIITGKRAFLEPFTASQRQVYRTLATLNALIVDQRGKPDPRTAQLHRLMDAKFAEMKNVRELRDSKGLEVAAGVIASGKGKQIMDSIRGVLGGMIQENEASLTRRLQSGKERVAFTRLSFWITLLNTSAIGFVVAVIIWTNRKARHVAGLQREEALARQKAIFESTSNPVILINPSGSIEVMNPAAEALFGFAATDLLRRDISLIVDLAPGDGPFLKRLGLTDGELAEPFRPHLLARRQNGDTVAVDVTLGPMPQGDGMHVVAVFRDISEREKIERMKDQFLSTISHELRTPLTSIVGSLGLLRGGAAAELPAAAQRLVVIAESNANRLIRIVNDLLDAEQLQSGQMTFDFKPLDLREAARNAVDGMRGLATTQSIALLIEEDGAPVMIRGDQDRLVQVIANLVSNAIKFSPKETRVTVSTKADFNGAHVRIVDQGPGIDPELRARLFTRFAQAARPMTSMPGTGLGLTISREIVHNHGGIIDFEDAPGGGSVFTFTLPAWNALTGQEDLNGAPRLLLYADAIDAMAITSGFAARSIRADAVGSAAAVLAAIEQRSYLAMILDFQFAEGEAIPLLHSIRAHPRGRDLPIIAIAAETPPVAPADMASLDIIDWITKPIGTPRLDEAVGAAVQRASVDMPLVLHVDDDSDTLEITARALGGLARIAQATDVASARAFLAGNRPDIVIIDLALPDGSGLDILAEINLADTPATPVIIYSAQDGGAGYAREVEAVLTKSKRSLPNLVETVLSILERQKRESSHA